MIRQSQPTSGAAADRIAELGRRVLDGHLIDRDEARFLASVEGDDVWELFYWANKIRIRFVGQKVTFCSIVTGRVGACSEDCGYCAQSKHYQTHVTPAVVGVDEIERAKDQALANGAHAFGVVNSGRGPTDRELDRLEPFYRKAREDGRIQACATLGELTPAQADRLAGMGATRINHNLETSRRNFPNVVTTHTYEDRLTTLRVAKEAGLQLCAGGIFGLGEDWEDRIDMALDLREVGADTVPVNFLYAIEGTPMERQGEQLEPLEALKIVALYRFLLPDRQIKVAGGRERVLRDMQSWMFYAGGSSFLIGNYLTTFGRDADADLQMLKDLNLPYVSFDGHTHDAEPGGLGKGGDVSLPVLA